MQKLGGLHVVGTERHESRRIDNQLRGRSGRQGDPGSTRYFLSLEVGGCSGVLRSWWEPRQRAQGRLNECWLRPPLAVTGGGWVQGLLGPVGGLGRARAPPAVRIGTRAPATACTPPSAHPPLPPLPPTGQPVPHLWRRPHQGPDERLPHRGPAHRVPDADLRPGRGAAQGGAGACASRSQPGLLQWPPAGACFCSASLAPQPARPRPRPLHHRWRPTSTTSASSCSSTTRCSTRRCATGPQGPQSGSSGCSAAAGYRALRMGAWCGHAAGTRSRRPAGHRRVDWPARSTNQRSSGPPRRPPTLRPAPQRDKVYAERRRALEAADLTPLMVEYAEKTIDDILEVGGVGWGGGSSSGVEEDAAGEGARGGRACGGDGRRHPGGGRALDSGALACCLAVEVHAGGRDGR